MAHRIKAHTPLTVVAFLAEVALKSLEAVHADSSLRAGGLLKTILTRAIHHG